MLERIAAIAVFLTIPSFAAVDDGSGGGAPIDVGLCVGPNDFYARNFSGVPQVLFFRSGEIMVWRVLPPGASFASTYPRVALDGLKIEVAHYAAGVWKTSRAFDLSNVCDSGGDALWIQDGTAPPSWIQIGSTLTLLEPEPSFLPEWLPTSADATSTANEPLVAPVHTPVVTPIDIPVGDLPPRIEDRPLPPV